MSVKPEACSPCQSSRTSKQACFTERWDVFSQKDEMCFSLLSVCALRVMVGQKLSLCYSPMGPQNASYIGHQSQAIKNCPLSRNHKTPGHKTCVTAPLQEILAFWIMSKREREKAPDSKVYRKDYSWPLDICLIKSLFLRLQGWR